MAAPKPVADDVVGLKKLTKDALESLRHLDKTIRAQLAKGTLAASMQREASAVARAITQLGSEMRQQEKFWKEQGEALDDDQVEESVVLWLAETSPARRKRIAEAIAELEGTNTLLG